MAPTFAVIGAGNMAEAILRGAFKAGILQPSDVIAADPSPQRRALFETQLHIATTADNAVAVASCEKVLLSVKPQMMGTALEPLVAALPAHALVISIAAGVKTSAIQSQLGKGRIVRVMPNTPMLVGHGATALAFGPGATQADIDWTEKLFASSGKTIIVGEELLDAVTAVSGSGPAYFFYLIEAMIQAGVEEGLSAEDARLLSVQTCLGAAQMLLESPESPEALRKKVTSPNGTTQAAIEKLEAAVVKHALVTAIRRAAERSRELGK